MENESLNEKRERLDRVYDVFSNLDRDYKRSKMTRSQFITDRFGGDIDVGSLLISEAISAEYDDQESVSKLSFLKDLFDKIEKNKAYLDAMTDFKFGATTVMDSIVGMLNRQLACMPRKVGELHGNADMFYVRGDMCEFVPLTDCARVTLYNPNLLGMYGGGGVGLSIGSVLKQKNGRVQKMES